jgi:hypothetical protein
MSPAFLFLLLSLVRGVVLDPTGRPVEVRNLGFQYADASCQAGKHLMPAALARTETGGLRITW